MGNSRKLISLWSSIFVLGAGLTLSGCDEQQEDENAEGKTSGMAEENPDLSKKAQEMAEETLDAIEKAAEVVVEIVEKAIEEVTNGDGEEAEDAGKETTDNEADDGTANEESTLDR